MPAQPQVAYNIEVIHDCIVRDTETYRKFNSKTKKRSIYRETEKRLDNYPELKKMIDPDFVRSLDDKRGGYVGKVAWMPSAFIVADQRIREMCRNPFTLPEPYAKAVGVGFGPCPGHGKMSACPPFSFSSEEARARLDDADIFIAIQSITFIDPPEHRGWQDVVINKFRKALKKAIGEEHITVVFGAGPCQLCYPKQCLGDGECRMPEQRAFALESSGVAVIQLCRDMAIVTGDKNWETKFSKYYGTSRQNIKHWKLTFGVGVRL